jgi:hypothetical protein
MVDERDAGYLGEHYRKCRDAMASIGFPLEFDFKHPQNWSDSAIAKAVWAAAEEDIEAIEDSRENIPSLSVYVYLMIDLIASWIAFMNSRSLKQGTLSL